MSDSSSSQDATLKTLAVSPGKLSPGFSAPRTAYHLYLPSSIDAIRVTPTTGDTEATLTLNGSPVSSGQPSEAVPLEVGRTVLQVEVTARDGKTKNAYRITVIRACPTLNWVKVTDKAPWIPRDSAGELVFNGRMWLFGGYTPPLVNDVWSSADGVNWRREGEIPDESGVNIPVVFAYDGRMWVTGGSGKLFASTDGATWTLVTDQAPWMGRGIVGSAVFAGRIWVLGGGRGGQFFNDIWSSTDGVRWTLETPQAPWSRRQIFSMAVHEDKLWVVGGGLSGYHPFRAYNDVWCSPDGKTWTQTTDQAPWPVRIWNTVIAYKNRLWVLGGFRAEPTWNNFDDVWYSADGANWHPLTTETIWSPRHEISVYVFDDKLWVIGGNAWPLMNDAWYLEIKGLTFLTRPPIEEIAGAQYTYRARADFNESGQKVRYRLVEGPAWLTLHPDTGLVRGTPEATGDVTVTLEAYDDADETARQTYTLHVI
ncbi:MAG: hypothetical protein EXS64_01995 [Candidatus Latescibacteria bacterium]|nr:hypothetical protein [Candidatus Latescibacterota bacterium]